MPRRLLEQMKADLAEAKAWLEELEDKLASAIDQMPDPPPTDGWRCENPHIGPIRRVPKSGRLLFTNQWGGPACAPFRQIVPGILQGATYMVANRCGGGPMDHSPQGIARHARAAWEAFKSRRKQDHSNIIWYDFEAGTHSVNVPGDWYSASGSLKGYAFTYDVDAPENYRQEAVRFFREFSRLLLAEANNDGVEDFEIGSYNHPNASSYANYGSSSRYERQSKDLTTLACPYLSFVGGACYFSPGRANRDKMSTTELVDFCIKMRAEQMRRIRAAFPSPQKILPPIWNLWFFGGEQKFPGGDQVVPAGAMKKMAEALLDNGADGFFIWDSSSDAEGSARGQERMEEVAQVIKADGRFVAP